MNTSSGSAASEAYGRHPMSFLSSHIQRLLTALVLLPLLAWAIASGPVVIGLLVGLVSVFGLWEFYSFFWPDHPLRKAGGIVLGGLVIAWQAASPNPAALPFLLALWAGNLFFLTQYARDAESAQPADGMIFSIGLMYIPGVLQLFIHLHPLEIVLVLLATFASDTGAYYAGCWWGRRKVWPVISPKKTWMGSMGGLGLCITLSLVLGLAFGDAAWYHWIWVGAVLNIAAQFGDFFESALKRKLQIKDSGRLLPGHGGLLDRIDSLLLVLPVYAAVTIFLPLFL
ncbi:phosphatidate cytidylyltransferase [Desulfohalobium retbaense]|nr:phosphatidate cytidylyltransferase [Desulfohalobium retbaense]